MKKLKILLSGCLIPTSLISTFSFVSCNTPQEEADFSTDSWENVVKYCNLGLEALLARYSRSLGIIGRERILTIDGVDHVVRVVGMNDDFIANEDGSPSEKTATLTFEFVDGLSYRYISEYETEEITGYDRWYYPNQEVSSSFGYLYSDIRSWLNNEIILKFPETVRKAIKTVSKKTLVADSSTITDLTDQTHIEQHGEKLFCPSQAELIPKEFFVEGKFKPVLIEEGLNPIMSQYDYYWSIFKHAPYKIDGSCLALMKWCAGAMVSGTIGWFLRSPGFWNENTEYKINPLCIDGSGRPHIVSTHNTHDCLAPFFCI